MMLESYYKKTLGFHKWVFETIRQMGLNELDERSKTRAELKELLKDIYGEVE